jgi:hypothetical protein
MAVPVWVPGQVLTASDVNTWLAPQGVVKPASQNVISSTVLVNDTDLVLPVAANASYIFDCFLDFTSVSGADLKVSWAVPSGASLLYQALHNEGGATGLNNSQLIYADSNTLFCAGNGATQVAAGLNGSLITTGTAGNLQLRWAQNTSTASNTTIRVQSYLMLVRVA